MLVTAQNFGSVVERLRRAPRLVVDTETNGLFVWHGSRLIGISIAPPGAPRRHCYYFPFRHKRGVNLSPKHMKAVMRLISEAGILTFWNAKFDLHMLIADGLPEPPRKKIEDCMLLFHLLDENQWKTGGSYELKVFAEMYIDAKARAAQLALSEILAERGLSKGDMQELEPELVEDYASDDVYYTDKARALLLPGAEEWEIDDIWREVSEYAACTRKMEDRGWPIDQSLAEQYIEECKVNMARLKRKIDRMVGHEINLRSNPQLQSWLELPSTAEKYVEERWEFLTGGQKKAITTLQEYRKWDRARGSYYEPFLANLDGRGVFHPNILTHGTISGRPSARGTPNVFAIPVYDEIYKVKDVVVARPGYSIISSDYAQAELRIAAHYTEDPGLTQAFKEGKSPHRLLLAELTELGVEISYEDTKRVSFAIMYGTGAPTLSKELKRGVKFAADVLKAAHALHPNYRPMLYQCSDMARQDGFIRLWTGRVRHFNTLPKPREWWHKACSNLIQGDVGEVMRHAICRLYDQFDGEDAHMLLQVYDQILFEVPTKEVKRWAPVIRREMTRDFPFKVPLAVDMKAGKRWGKLEEIK